LFIYGYQIPGMADGEVQTLALLPAFSIAQGRVVTAAIAARKKASYKDTGQIHVILHTSAVNLRN
jgi:hypothetical protein